MFATTTRFRTIAALLGVLLLWSTQPLTCAAQRVPDPHRGFGIVSVRLNPADNSGMQSIDVELVNGSAVTVAAYGLRVLTQYVNGDETASHHVMDLSLGIGLREVFPGQKFSSLDSLLPRQHAVFHTVAGQDPNGSPAVSAHAVITSVLFADGVSKGDMQELKAFLGEWADEVGESSQWLPQVAALGNCTSNSVAAAASSLSAKMAAAPADPNVFPMYALTGRSLVKENVDAISAMGQAIQAAPGSYSAATGLNPATSLDSAIKKRISLVQWRTNFLLVMTGGAAIGTSTNPVPPVSPPTLASISPTSALVGGSPLTLTLSGSNFFNGSAGTAAQVNGVSRAATFVNTNQVTIGITANDLAKAQTLQIAVVDPATCNRPSAPLNFTVNNPGPTISSLSPTSSVAGSPTVTLTVNGTNFVSGATVQVNGTSLPTTFLSATQLTASIPASDIQTPTTLFIVVLNPAPSPGASAPASFTVNAPSPDFAVSLSTGNASVVQTASGSTSVTVTSLNGFNGATSLSVSGVPSGVTASFSAASLTPTPGGVATSQLTFAASRTAAVGTFTVTITASSASGSHRATLSLTIAPANPAPSITSISPMNAFSGGGDFTLTINGSGFMSTSTVNVSTGNSSSARVATFVNSTQLTITIPSIDIATSGSQLTIWITNSSPGGGVSNPATLNVQ